MNFIGQGLELFDTGNYEDNFSEAMEFMNNIPGHSLGFVLASGKIAVLPQQGYLYKGKRKTKEYVDGKYSYLRDDVVPNKKTKNGYFLLINGEWEQATKMIVGGFAEGVHGYQWETYSRSYIVTDRLYQDWAATLGVSSLIYFLNPPAFNRSSIPYQ